MSEFNIIWPSGLSTVECSECTTLDAYAMERWGVNSMEEVTAQYDVKVTLHGALEQPPVVTEQLPVVTEQPPVAGQPQ